MKRFLIIGSLVLFALTGMVFTASAQVPNSSPVVIQPPEHWVNETSDVNNYRIAVFVDTDNENRIEIFKRTLVRDSYGEQLFEAFYEQLKNSNFTVVTPAKEHKFDLANGSTRTGRLAEYEFSSAGLSISTAIFGFVVKDEKPTAFLVVGYFAKANRNEGMEAFNALLRNMVDEKSN